MDYESYDDYDNLEYSEANDRCELLEDGVMLEHFTAIRDDIETEPSNDIYGSDSRDYEVWSKSAYECSDSVMCEKYISDVLTDDSVTEEDIRSFMEKSGTLDPEYGCTHSDVGAYLENAGLDISREYDLTVKDLCEALDNNEKIICSISGIALYHPELSDMPGLSGDSFIEIICIDETDPENKTVIVNDPYGDRGGSPIKYDDFVTAWEKGGQYAVLVSGK